MAGGHPQYGGYNDVPALDMGQDGGVLQLAGQARCTLTVTEGATEIGGSKQALPEVQAAYEAIVSYGGRPVTFTGTIWAVSNTVLDTIEANLRSYERGVIEAAAGVRTQDLTRIRATKLTTPWGRVIGLRTKLKKYVARGPRKHGQHWLAIQEGAVIFEVLE